MATTQARPARPSLPPPLLRAGSLAERARATPPALLGAALAIAAVYAAFANGAIEIPDETRLQVGIAAVSILTIGGLTFGRGLRAAAHPAAYAGIAALAGFAIWCAVSLAWSITADGSWLDPICVHYGTAMACIILQIPNNYQPILQK